MKKVLFDQADKAEKKELQDLFIGNRRYSCRSESTGLRTAAFID